MVKKEKKSYRKKTIFVPSMSQAPKTLHLTLPIMQLHSNVFVRPSLLKSFKLNLAINAKGTLNKNKHKKEKKRIGVPALL